MANVNASVGATNVEVLLYAGEQGFYAGVDQINLRLPQSLSGTGDTPITVNVDGVPANAVNVQIK